MRHEGDREIRDQEPMPQVVPGNLNQNHIIDVNASPFQNIADWRPFKLETMDEVVFAHSKHFRRCFSRQHRRPEFSNDHPFAFI